MNERWLPFIFWMRDEAERRLLLLLLLLARIGLYFKYIRGSSESSHHTPSCRRTTRSGRRPMRRPMAHRLSPLQPKANDRKKSFYRQRAHCNPLSHNDSFQYPVTPADMDWSVPDLFPNLPAGTVPTVLDVGCGEGGPHTGKKSRRLDRSYS